MKKLKNKVFSVIFGILTIFLISILAIFNYQDYAQRYENIKSNLMRMDDTKNIYGEKTPNADDISNMGDINNNDNASNIDDLNKENDINNVDNLNQENDVATQKIFMDLTVYAVVFDNEGNIIDVINHTTNSISEDEIKEIAEEIVQNRGNEDTKIGNIYFEKYSYSFSRDGGTLIIIDNTTCKEALMQTLKTSLIIFVVLEFIIIIISKKLTSWIIIPVLESFNKQKQFIADASHELKTPLSVIIASSEALENEPEEKKWLNNIKSESERMNNLISDLLDMAKSENKIEEKYVVENLSKLVEKSVLTFESLMYEKDVRFTYNIDENISLWCNPDQIKQVIGILIDNATKHCSKNGEIKVNLKKERTNIVLDVINTGKEIPKEIRDKIFERFYREDESRNRDENRYGLGLAIAKNIVTNHNGKIYVNCENGYTTFKIIFKFTELSQK